MQVSGDCLQEATKLSGAKHQNACAEQPEKTLNAHKTHPRWTGNYFRVDNPHRVQWGGITQPMTSKSQANIRVNCLYNDKDQ